MAPGDWRLARHLPQAAVRAVREAFDADYYRAANPDVAAAGVDPLLHFVARGWREGRDPRADFSIRRYVEAHPEVAASGINPFAHFLLHGGVAGARQASGPDVPQEIVVALPAPEVRFEAALRAGADLATQPATVLGAALQALGSGRGLHVTFGHDDYTQTYGGSQLCLRLEGAACADRGLDHLHVFPAAQGLVLRRRGEPGPLGVLLNGAGIGVFSAAAIGEAAFAMAGEGRPAPRFAIHSLLGHDPDEVVDIVRAFGASWGVFWLHDYASLCAGFQLLRNDVQDCAAPPPDSAACTICAYRPLRMRHVEGHARLFAELAPLVASPSQNALAFWRRAWDFPVARTVVHPHARLVPSRRGAPAHGGRRLRVAFAGMPVAFKGWLVFRDLAERFQDDDRYEFLHLGAFRAPCGGASFHEVVADGERPDAMRAALEALEVDVAILWPLCRETFSFVAYEAAAAGAAIITNPDSGNLADFVSGRSGWVLKSQDDLMATFAGGEVLRLGRGERRPPLFDLAYSALSLDLQ